MQPQSAPAEPRSADLTRPLRLGRLAIIAGVTTTAALVLMLSLGVGRGAFGFAPDMPPGKIELSVQNPGASGLAAFKRQIGMSPDGSAVVFTMKTDEGDDVIASQELDSETPVIMEGVDSIAGERDSRARAIEANATRAVGEKIVELRYAAGHIVYARPDGSLWAAPFDQKTNRMTAKPVQIGANVALTGTGIAQFAVSKNGNVAYLPEGPRSLVIVTRDGHLRDATSERRFFSNPRFSPDGKRVATDINDTDGRDVWTVDVNNGSLKQATFEQDAHDAVWAPDGKSITYTSYRLGALGIYRSAPGVKKADSVFTAQPLVYSGEWLKDGSGLITTASNLSPASGLDVAFIANGGRGPIVPVVVDRSGARFPVVSPDEKWLAYVSNAGGRDEVYVRPWNRDGEVIRISSRGGTEPVWSPDGSILFYRESGSQFLIAASLLVSPGRGLVAVRQGSFPITEMVPGFTHANFDISPDGAEFVMVMKARPGGIKVLTNVPEILRRAGGAQLQATKK